jgi:hypothetical protein
VITMVSAMVVVAKPSSLRWWGLCSVWPLQADWLHCTSDLMYLTNVQRLALHLEGTPDPSLAVVQAAVTKTGYKGYVAPGYVAAAPAAAGGGAPPPPPAPGATTVKAARR